MNLEVGRFTAEFHVSQALAAAQQSIRPPLGGKARKLDVLGGEQENLEGSSDESALRQRRIGFSHYEELREKHHLMTLCACEPRAMNGESEPLFASRPRGLAKKVVGENDGDPLIRMACERGST
jgi:hypothetical protein